MSAVTRDVAAFAMIRFWMIWPNFFVPVTTKRARERWTWPVGYTGRRDDQGEMILDRPNRATPAQKVTK